MQASTTKYATVLGLLVVLIVALALGLRGRSGDVPVSGAPRADNDATQSSAALLDLPDSGGEREVNVTTKAPAVETEAEASEGTTDSEAPESEDKPAYAVFVGNSDIVISKLQNDGFYSLKFPALKPTEARDREFFVFGAAPGAEPNLLIVHVHTAHDPSDLPILLAANLWERFDQIVVTVPEWADEEARVVVSVSRTGRGSTLRCPGERGPTLYRHELHRGQRRRLLDETRQSSESWRYEKRSERGPGAGLAREPGRARARRGADQELTPGAWSSPRRRTLARLRFPVVDRRVALVRSHVDDRFRVRSARQEPIVDEPGTAVQIER